MLQYLHDPVHVYALATLLCTLLSLLPGKIGAFGKTTGQHLPQIWAFIRANAKLFGLAFLAGSLLCGCVGSFQNVPGDTNPLHSSRCGNLDSKHRAGLTTASVATGAGAVLGTAGGLEAKNNDNTAKYLAISGGLIGAVGVAAGIYAIDAGNSFQQECTAPVVATPAAK